MTVEHNTREIEDGVVTDLEPETPVDSTAAGDSFNAGYLSASLSGAECAARRTAAPQAVAW